MALDVFHHHDGIIDDETDRKHDREQGEQIHGEPEDLHEKDRADERDRNRDDWDDDGAPRAKEKVNHDHHNEERLQQRMEDVLDGGIDISRAVVGDATLHPGGQFALDLFHLGLHAFDDINRVCVWQDKDAHENGALSGETDLGVIVLRSEDDVGNVAQPNECSAFLSDDEVFEVIDGMQIGISGEINLNESAFRAPEAERKLLLPKRLTDLRRADIEGCHLLWLEPDAHGERASGQNVRALDATEGRKARLNDAR